MRTKQVEKPENGGGPGVRLKNPESAAPEAEDESDAG